MIFPAVQKKNNAHRDRARKATAAEAVTTEAVDARPPECLAVYIAAIARAAPVRGQRVKMISAPNPPAQQQHRCGKSGCSPVFDRRTNIHIIAGGKHAAEARIVSIAGAFVF
jgi:hypothetical protein